MVDIEPPKKKAAGIPAVLSSFKFGFREMGPVRTGIFNVADVQIMVGLGLLLLGRRRTGAGVETPA